MQGTHYHVTATILAALAAIPGWYLGKWALHSFTALRIEGFYGPLSFFGLFWVIYFLILIVISKRGFFF